MIPTEHKTTKLFYNKWPYKLVVLQDSAYYIRHRGPKWVLAQAGTPGRAMFQEKDTINFATRMLKYWDRDIQLRTSGTTLSIFCKEEKLFYEMEIDFARWAHEVHAPANREELNFLMAQTAKKVICNTLPHKKYKYRVNIKSTMKPDLRPNFLNWLAKYNQKSSVADHTIKWAINGLSGYGFNPCVLIEDSPTLTMAMLFLGDNVRNIEEFVPRFSINTSLEQDNTCQHLA